MLSHLEFKSRFQIPVEFLLVDYSGLPHVLENLLDLFPGELRGLRHLRVEGLVFDGLLGLSRKFLECLKGILSQALLAEGLVVEKPDVRFLGVDVD